MRRSRDRWPRSPRQTGSASTDAPERGRTLSSRADGTDAPVAFPFRGHRSPPARGIGDGSAAPSGRATEGEEAETVGGSLPEGGVRDPWGAGPYGGDHLDSTHPGSGAAPSGWGGGRGTTMFRTERPAGHGSPRGAGSSGSLPITSDRRSRGVRRPRGLARPREPGVSGTGRAGTPGRRAPGARSA